MVLGFMSKLQVFWLIVAISTIFLVAGNLISKAINPLDVQNETFECVANECTLTFDIHNESDQTQNGTVKIHYRENSSFATAKAMRVFRSVEKPFIIDANGSQTYLDIFRTRREKVNYYFAISTNKT